MENKLSVDPVHKLEMVAAFKSLLVISHHGMPSEEAVMISDVKRIHHLLRTFLITVIY